MIADAEGEIATATTTSRNFQMIPKVTRTATNAGGADGGAGAGERNVGRGRYCVLTGTLSVVEMAVVTNVVSDEVPKLRTRR